MVPPNPQLQRTLLRQGFGGRSPLSRKPLDRAVRSALSVRITVCASAVLEQRFRKGAEMEKHEVQTSPQLYARIGGVLYLITIV